MQRMAWDLWGVIWRAVLLASLVLGGAWALGLVRPAAADAYLFTQKDQVDGRNTYLIGIFDGKLTRVRNTMLAYRCPPGGALQAAIQIEGRNYGRPGERVRFRIDGGPVQEMDVPEMTAAAVVRQLKAGNVLHLKLAGGAKSYRFTLGGVTKAFATVERQCPLP